MVNIQEGQGKYKVILETIKSGEDLTIIIYGGEKPHIGALAVSMPRPSLKNAEKVSASTSVFTLVGHKEDELAKKIAENITKTTKRITVAIVGLHIEKATVKDIDCLLANTQKLVNRLKKLLKESDIDSMLD